MKKKYSIIAVIFGLVIFLIGLLIYFFIPVIIYDKLSQLLPLKNGTFIYEQWKSPTSPIFFEIWYFTVVNPDEILKGEKPYVKQVGPYCYREHRVKNNITFNSNGTITYIEKRLFYFDRDRSVGDENDTLTVVNIPVVVIGNEIKNMKKVVRQAASAFIQTFENHDFFFQTSVRNITWGYTDPMLLKLSDFVRKHNLTLNINIDPVVGLMHGKNNTYDGVYTIDSGSVNLDNYLHINRWNGSDHLSMWNNRYANMINGTDGSMFGPFLNESSKLYLFQTDICRSLLTTFVTSGTIKGIPSYVYSVPDSIFANTSVNPDNAGFCLNGYCLGTGLLNLTNCVGGVPIVMSEPHFYKVAAKYRDAVDGLSPNVEYKTSLALEPTTGVPLNVQKKMQLNIALEPIPDYVDIENIPRVFLPLIWINESALIDDDSVDQLKRQLIVPGLVAKWLAVTAIIVGVLMLTVVLVIVSNGLLRKKFSSSASSSKFVKLSDESQSINTENT